MKPETSKPERVLRLHDVLNRTGVSRSTLYAMIKTGEFPSPIALGPNSRGWLESVTEEWVRSRPTVDLRRHADARAA